MVGLYQQTYSIQELRPVLAEFRGHYIEHRLQATNCYQAYNRPTLARCSIILF